MNEGLGHPVMLKTHQTQFLIENKENMREKMGRKVLDTVHDLMTRYRNENCSNLAYVFPACYSVCLTLLFLLPLI